MTSRASRPVIIEAALNGGRTPADNPHVPVTTEALVADALACLDAGAAVIHTHAPERTSDPARAAEQYLAHYQPVLDVRPDALLYPTIVFDTGVEDRIEHLRLLADEGAIRIGLMEPGSGSFVGTGDDGLPVPRDGAYVNTPADVRYMADRCRDWRLGPSMVIFEPGFLQHALAYVRAGRMPAGVFARLTLCGGQSNRGPGLVDLLFGLPSSPRSLDVYLDLLGDAPMPWAVSVVSGDVFADGVATHAVERGGHLRVGLEDHAGPEQPTNVELVERAVALVESLGHRVASCAEAADILGLPEPSR
ncbi:MAG: 3-keto-5-aminohexanoate cleavage protein [Acidimicrobiales bacterium]|nr:3-keto-5-aminohexanoate cleavage protein [Acidimicrobiales bacterium]